MFCIYQSSWIFLSFFCLFLNKKNVSFGFSFVKIPMKKVSTNVYHNTRRYKNELLKMHNHDHNHDHNHNHNVNHDSITLVSPPVISMKYRVLISSLLIVIPSIIKHKINKFDIGMFVLVTITLSVLDTTRSFLKSAISRFRIISESIFKHTKPITRNYIFKNDNAADRVTILGVFINILLSIIKFVGGIWFHSAVLIADAGHSLSDLFSDFITLWAVQIARLPPDDDHPYGHGKFESIGSLALSLTLLGTGLSVGSWSYEKLMQVLILKRGILSTTIDVPSWPALILAAISIISKEWLFQITKRVGQMLNSQILIANAWHHRSDAFSSIISLVSIALAILVPQFLFLDSAAGILVAGMICFSGFEIFFESVKQLTDTSDNSLIPEIYKISQNIGGVMGVSNIRTRNVGSGIMVDLVIQVDTPSATSSQTIAEKVRWTILESKISNIIDVSVRPKLLNSTICPLLIARNNKQKSQNDIIEEVRDIIQNHKLVYNNIENINKITVHYVNTLQMSLDIIITTRNDVSITELSKEIQLLKESILQKIPDVVQSDILLAV